jgi:nucleoside-diphosphate-sugar epimerase
MEILVTGGAGFIGSHLVDALLARPDARVRVLDNLYRGNWANLAQHAADPRLTPLRADLRDVTTLREAMRGVDTVFHLAAQSNVLGAVREPRYAFESNVAGTFNVLEAAVTAGVRRLIFASSREAYGEPQTLPVREDAPLAAKNGYGASKAAGELYCRAFSADTALETVVLRLANVYGPRDVDRVIPRWLTRAEAGEPLDVYGGDQLIDFVPVQTVVAAFLRAAEADVAGLPINVGSGVGTPILALAERLRLLCGRRSEVRLLPAHGAEVRAFVADTRRMRALLGVMPPSDPLCGLAEMLPATAGAR